MYILDIGLLKSVNVQILASMRTCALKTVNNFELQALGDGYFRHHDKTCLAHRHVWLLPPFLPGQLAVTVRSHHAKRPNAHCRGVHDQRLQHSRNKFCHV